MSALTVPEPGIENACWADQYGIRHIAIIPDGNRRWATGHGRKSFEGHRAGMLLVLKLLDELATAGVHTQTYWAFSTENWARQRIEVEFLMDLFAEFLEWHALALAEKHDAKIVHLGRRDRLNGKLLSMMDLVSARTAGNTSHIFNFAIDYGGEDELDRAARKLALAASQGRNPDELHIGDFLDTAGQPHPKPDILIRTSGEQRLSGFLPHQSAYSEVFFVDTSFPDLGVTEVEGIARRFAQRERRFGS